MLPECRPIRAAALSVAVAMTLVATTTTLAQGEVQPTTISAIEQGEVAGSVSLVGSALAQTGDGEYGFSDGTGVYTISIDASNAQIAVPLFSMISVEGMVAGVEIDVTSWAPLDILTAAVIVPEEQVIEAFQGWIIAYGMQAPE